MPQADDSAGYWQVMEQSRPEIWPGSLPWSDAWGSFGTLPDASGLGCSVMRTRVPPAQLPAYWQDITARYAAWPRFSIGPFDTPGLRDLLAQNRYTLEERERVVVLRRGEWLALPGASAEARAVTTHRELAAVLALDHAVFDDPPPTPERIEAEWGRLTAARQVFFVAGPDGTAASAGGFTDFGDWALLWGGETAPAHRGRGFYQAVVHRRLQALQAHHAVQFAAAQAREGTSAPILARLGFRDVGSIEVWAPPHALRASAPTPNGV